MKQDKIHIVNEDNVPVYKKQISLAANEKDETPSTKSVKSAMPLLK